MKVRESVKDYERWLRAQLEVVEDDLDTKHRQMRKSAFVFMRASYPRWLQRIADVAPELEGPPVASVGDLHVRNFGTWRDGEGRHVWGIDDFDESEQLPYTYDLARLAASAIIALEEGKGATGPAETCMAILSGYSHVLVSGGGPFVLGERRARLARLVSDAVPDAADWWQGLQGELLDRSRRHDRLSEAAQQALEPVKPAYGWEFDTRRRVAGMGSLGRRRLVLIGEHDGGLAAREVKQLAPPASAWLGREVTARATISPALRSADPFVNVSDGWLARRLSPDYVKLDLGEQRGRTDERRLLQWMGAETANVHLAGGGSPADVRSDVAGRREGWLKRSVDRLVRATRVDWQDWRRG